MGALVAFHGTLKIRQNSDPKPQGFPWWKTLVGSCSGLRGLPGLFMLSGKGGRHMPLDIKAHTNALFFFFSLYSRGSQWPTSWHPRSQPFLAVAILPCTKSPKPQDDLNSTIDLAGSPYSVWTCIPGNYSFQKWKSAYSVSASPQSPSQHPTQSRWWYSQPSEHNSVCRYSFLLKYILFKYLFCLSNFSIAVIWHPDQGNRNSLLGLTVWEG